MKNLFLKIAVVAALCAWTGSRARAATLYQFTGNGQALSDYSKWSGGTMSQSILQSGSSSYNFRLGSGAGSSAVMPAFNVNLYYVRWYPYGGWGSFDLKANGSYQFQVGAGGMKTDSANAFTIGAPVVLKANQTWITAYSANVNANITLNSTLTGSYVLTKDGPGAVQIGTTSGTFSWKATYIKNGDIRVAGRSNFWPSGHELYFSNSGTAANVARLNLAVSEIFKDVYLHEADEARDNGFTSPDSATHTLAIFTGTPQVNPTRFTGYFDQGAGLCWNPSSSSYQLVLSGAGGDTQGNLIVSNGTVSVVDGYEFTHLSEVGIYGSSSRFEVGPVGKQFTATSLQLGSGGRIVLLDKTTAGTHMAAKNLTFDTVRVDGSLQASGVYTGPGGSVGRTVTWISGTGTVTVAGCTWTAKGSTTSITNTSNWDASATVSRLGDGTVTPVFAQSGTEANLPAAASVRLRGLLLQSPNNFTFTSEEGARNVWLGAAGFITTPQSSVRTYRIDWPFHLSSDQNWVVNGSDTVILNGGLDGTAAIVRDGSGTLCVNTPAAGSSYAGAISILKGNTYLSGVDPLGTGDIAFTWSNAYLYLTNATLHSKIVSSATKNVGMRLLAVNGTTNHIYGALNMTAGGNATMGSTGTGITHLHGGIWGAGNFTGYNLVIDDRPLLLTDRLSGPCTITLNVASNWFGGNTWINSSNGRMVCRVPYALYRGPRNERGEWNNSGYTLYNHFAGMSNTILDLGGYNQELCGFCVQSGYAATCCVTSGAPAQLEIHNDAAYQSWDGYGPSHTNNYVRFVGAAGLKVTAFSTKNLTYPMCITLRTSSPTKGKLEVAVDEANITTLDNDMLILNPSVQWSNCPEVGVSCGTLKLQRADTFGSQVVVNVTSNTAWSQGGRLWLNYTGAQTCSALYLNGRRQRTGTYGAPGSGAKFIDTTGRLYGTGILNVQGDGSQRAIFHFK